MKIGAYVDKALVVNPALFVFEPQASGPHRIQMRSARQHRHGVTGGQQPPGDKTADRARSDNKKTHPDGLAYFDFQRSAVDASQNTILRCAQSATMYSVTPMTLRMIRMANTPGVSSLNISWVIR